MTQAIPQTEPLQITAGDFIQWLRAGGNYPAPDWDFSYILINATNKYSINAADSGTDHLVTIDATTSAAYVAGLYQWQAYATNGSQRMTVAQGEMTIQPNFSGVSVLETRSTTKQTLDAIEAVILNRASTDQEMYTIGGRSLKRTPLADLVKLRDRYAAMYLSEQNAEKVKNGLAKGNRIFVRFSR